MRILVTGGAGFIGSNLVRLLVSRGHDVLNIDKLTYAGNPSSLADLQDHPRHRFLQADICDAAAMRAAFADFLPEAVMHLAAESHVDRSIDGPGDFIHTNILGTYTLLEAAREYQAACKQETRNGEQKSGNREQQAALPSPDLPTLSPSDLLTSPTPAESASSLPTDPCPPLTSHPFRFLHVSTDEVFGSLGPEAPAFNESTAYDPHSPYSASKAASDHLTRAWHDTYGLPVLITNCSNNYGPFQFPEKLIPVVILKALRGEPIPVYGKGENIRDWLYVEDHAEALLTVLERGRVGETYTIGGNNELRNIDLVRLLCALVDELAPRSPVSCSLSPGSSKSLITFVTDRPGHDLRYAIDPSKIHRELGWTPQQDHQSGFRKTVLWYLENQTWWQDILNGSYQLERVGNL